MRSLLLVLLAACNVQYHDVEIVPESAAPLGVGLVESFGVVQDRTTDIGDPDTVPAEHVTVTLAGDGSVLLEPLVPYEGFQLLGVAPGTTHVTVTANDGWTTGGDVAVADVAATRLFVQRSLALGNLYDHVQVFTGASVPISQASAGSDHTVRAGSAPLIFDPQTTAASFDPACSCVATGDVPGEAIVSATAGRFVLDVVDASAISKFSIDGKPAQTLALRDNGTEVDLVLVPEDAEGRPIVGPGPVPTIQVGDRHIATVHVDDGGVGRTLRVVGTNPGTTTIDITWGTAHVRLDVVSS